MKWGNHDIIKSSSIALNPSPFLLIFAYLPALLLVSSTSSSVVTPVSSSSSSSPFAFSAAAAADCWDNTPGGTTRDSPEYVNPLKFS
jgi:hypothetical protein